ncbi:hypothetical protein [Bacillus sp. FJAT-27225]|uniref:hypothetical protein n=1 Tax=Bacillus sp. FJAT-27225 TaxID=1743144 RepID=UPI0015866207|nr:hypothetical protein [Bacillus sp. FJAT-27225]
MNQGPNFAKIAEAISKSMEMARQDTMLKEQSFLLLKEAEQNWKRALSARKLAKL